MSRPAVTVVIGTYNQGGQVGEAIESVLGQDYPSDRMEVIVVDDGSSDDTPRRVAAFAGRVSYVRQPNQGQAAAINAGVERARGEIVALLDGDDVWYTGKLSRVVGAFERDERAALVFHNTTLSLFGGAFRCGMNAGDSADCLTIVNDLSDLDGADLMRFAPVATSCSLSFRKRLLKNVFPIPPSYRYYADGYLFTESLFCGRVLYIKSCLAEYRAHNITTFCFFGASPSRRGIERMRLVLGLFELHGERLARRFRDFGLDYSRTEASAREVAARTRAFLDRIAGPAGSNAPEGIRLRLGGNRERLEGYTDLDESPTTSRPTAIVGDGAAGEILSINALNNSSDDAMVKALTKWKRMLGRGGAIFSVERRSDDYGLSADRIKAAAREVNLKVLSIIPGYSYGERAILTRLSK